ncbi:MAG TPA: YggS family pyridoxal phosphate-dependent enzyme [Methylomirabilota bacterium]|nr:YggS family pyridoxal phosphate-dependent enzyme [Methylomirabilota bacterium]
MRPGHLAGAFAFPPAHAPMQPIDEPALTAELIRSRSDAVLARLRECAVTAGRDPEGVRLVAVTKGFGGDVIREAWLAGLTRFGENRVQEAIPKMDAAPGAEWHLVGRLQANKVRPAVRAFAAIHSVDSLDLLARVDRISAEERRSPSVFLQVNVTGEATKAGFPLGWFEAAVQRPGPLADAIAGLGAARLVGLMTIGPAGVLPEESRRAFATLRQLRDRLALLTGRPLPELSMGMTADADAAVAEGATLVRIGTAIFGPRLT